VFLLYEDNALDTIVSFCSTDHPFDRQLDIVTIATGLTGVELWSVTVPQLRTKLIATYSIFVNDIYGCQWRL
jgi:hypothetical protein